MSQNMSYHTLLKARGWGGGRVGRGEKREEGKEEVQSSKGLNQMSAKAPRVTLY